jgi:hypothetical protein
MGLMVQGTSALGGGAAWLVYRQVRDKWFSNRDGPKNGRTGMGSQRVISLGIQRLGQ